MFAPDSVLVAAVPNGIGAVKAAHRELIVHAIRGAFSDSLNLDKAMRTSHPSEPRWDYLLGHRLTSSVIGLEPHSAATGQITAVIEKRKHARIQLQGHLRSGARVADWFWVASGKIDFVPHERAMIRLANNGITFVGKQLLEKHLKARGT